MEISRNGGYHARIENCELVRMPDGKSAFKVYFVSITGRDNPARFEWDRNSLTKQAFLEQFVARGEEGIGFVTAFPHITKVFRYAPKSEILMTVKAYNTQTGESVNLDRGEGYMEFACLAEAILAAGEYRVWGAAGNVEAYLETRCASEDAPVIANDKMLRYWEA